MRGLPGLSLLLAASLPAFLHNGARQMAMDLPQSALRTGLHHSASALLQAHPPLHGAEFAAALRARTPSGPASSGRQGSAPKAWMPPEVEPGGRKWNRLQVVTSSGPKWYPAS